MSTEGLSEKELQDIEDTKTDDKSKDKKVVTTSEAGSQSDTFTIDIKDSTKDDATQQALISQQKKIEELEKKATKAEEAKDDLEKQQLIADIEGLGYKTKSLKTQPLAAVKAVAETLKESGKDILITTKKAPTHKGRNITHMVDGKSVPWVDRYSGLKKKDD